MKWKYPTSSRWNCPKICGHHLGFILKLEVSHGFATSKHIRLQCGHGFLKLELASARRREKHVENRCCLQIFTGSLLNVWANYANSMPMGWLSLLDLIFDTHLHVGVVIAGGVPTIGYELGCTFWWNAIAIFGGRGVEKTTWIRAILAAPQNAG